MIREAKLPVSLEAERAILGAILLNNSLLPQAAQLNPEDFSLDAHCRIYACIRELREQQCAVDTITLVEALNRHDELERVGGGAYLSSLIDGVPDRPSIEHYVRILKNKAVLRETAKFGESIRDHVSQPGASPDTVRERIATFQNKLDSAVQTPNRIQRWEQIPTLNELPTESVVWDVEGLVPSGGITLIAGESGACKTWLALLLAKTLTSGGCFLGRECACKEVLYLDRENPASLIRERVSRLEMDGLEGLRYWGGWHQEQPPAIGDPRLLRILGGRKPVIFFDSLLRFHDADENSASEMGRIMGELRRLANTGATIIALHHKSEKDISQYRGSSDIKAGVDVALAVSYDAERDLETIRCFKNRFGVEFALAVKPDLQGEASFKVLEDPGEVLQRDQVERLREIIASTPGLNQSEVIKKSGLPKGRADSLLKRHAGQLWVTQPGPRNSLRYYPPEAGEARETQHTPAESASQFPGYRGSGNWEAGNPNSQPPGEPHCAASAVASDGGRKNDIIEVEI
jgi:hypothetical protein